ncbi:hypothetical protein F2Q69_00013424 [Brassica cretica]|uniref:Uncharacterized protein n=1 Tax=Brassica cretica TaxID=69181 RepID=A0A8S9R9Z9_BRACR|nr:hypothetical protein F2Q69_00013424 [Brassica cretica]
MKAAGTDSVVPTRPFASWTASVGPTRQMGELDGLLGPILPFGGFDIGVSLFGIRSPRP